MLYLWLLSVENVESVCASPGTIRGNGEIESVCTYTCYVQALAVFTNTFTAYFYTFLSQLKCVSIHVIRTLKARNYLLIN